MSHPDSDLPAGLRLLYADSDCNRYEYEQGSAYMLFTIYLDGRIEVEADSLYAAEISVEALRWIIDLAEQRKADETA